MAKKAIIVDKEYEKEKKLAEKFIYKCLNLPNDYSVSFNQAVKAMIAYKQKTLNDLKK